MKLILILLILFTVPSFASNSAEDDNMLPIEPKQPWTGGACGG
tara:strand:+ start:141 stop:269 length:129 start_codon:yes stop_codon:yes gene_type:complete